MKKLFLTVAMLSFVGAATLTAGEPTKGDDKGKKKECCKKDGKSCCKKGEKTTETKSTEEKK
jgi:hypothetical protein